MANKGIFVVLMGAVFALVFFRADCAAQIRGARVHDKVVSLSPEEADSNWEKFKKSGIACDYCMDFKISHAPRRGQEVEYVGEIFGAKANALGEEKMRIRIKKSDSDKFEDWLLVFSPDRRQVWKFEGGKAREISELDIPICGGLLVSPFDFMMPFKSWKSNYEGSGRIGQAVHFYSLVPENPGGGGKIEKVVVALTREFNSPAQVETFGKGGEEKVLSLGSVKKIDGLWMMLQFELLDKASRDRDTLRFTAAKVRAKLDPDVFSPDNLGKVPNKPALDKL